MSTDRREVAIGLACAFLTIITWSGFILLSRHAAREALTPYDLAALRFGVALVCLLPFLRPMGLFRLAPARGVAIALTAGIGFTLFAVGGLALAPAAHGGVLMPGTLPLWTAILAMLVLGERLGRPRLWALALILAGVGCMMAESLDGSALPGQWRGDLMFLGGAVSWSVFTILTRRWAVSPLQATVALAFYASLLYLPIYALFLPKGLADTPLATIALHGAFQGVISVVLNIVLFTRAVAALGAPTTTMITAAVPATVAVSAWPLLGEPASPLVLVGVAASTLGILGAVWFAARGGLPRARTAAPNR